MTPKSTAWILILPLAAGLLGCTSEEGRRRAQQAQIKRNIAQEDEDVQARESYDERNQARLLQEQEKLDAVEQKRSGNVYAHSCRKVTAANMDLDAVAVDKSGCSAEQLRQEEEAEKRQVFDKAFEDAAERDKKRSQSGLLR